MANVNVDISQELARILTAIYGEEVRDSIHDALETMNGQLNDAIDRQVLLIDSTLSVRGQAGDAKAVGDAITTAESSVSSIRDTVVGVDLADGTDLNTIDTAGLYRLLGSRGYTCGGDANWKPDWAVTAAYTGYMQVIHIGSNCLQTVRFFSSSEHYINYCATRMRGSDNSHWGEWQESIDETLSVLGQAADAKITGNRLSAIRDDTLYSYYVTSKDDLVDVWSVSNYTHTTGYGIINGNYERDIAVKSNQECTPLVPVSEGEYVMITKCIVSNSWTINYYNVNKEVIASYPNTYVNMCTKAPVGTKFVRLSRIIDSDAKMYVVGKDLMDYKDIFKMSVSDYGSMNGVAINVSNGAIASNSNLSISGYIPIKGYYVSFMNSLNTNTYGFAFYDKDLTLIPGALYAANNSNRYKRYYHENAYFIRVTYTTAQESTSSIICIKKDSPLVSLSSALFGTIGDGITNDTVALQEAFNFCGQNKIALYIPSGTYRITSSLEVLYSNFTVRGIPYGQYAGTRISAEVYSPTPVEGVQPVVDRQLGCCIVVKATSCNISDLILTPNIIKSTDYYDKNELVLDGIRFEPTASYVGNIDGIINRCLFVSMRKGIEINGRNLEIENCLFSHCSIGIKLNWSQYYALESRGILISHNRFHSMGRNTYGGVSPYSSDKVCIQFPDYANEDSIHDSVIDDNYADFCGTFFKGAAFGVKITNNNFYLARGSFVDSTSYDLVASGNVVKELSDVNDFFPTGLPESHTGFNIYSSTEKNTSSTYMTDYIDIGTARAIDIGFSFGSNYYGHAFYDENKDFITATAVNYSGVRIVPDNAKYIRFTVLTTNDISANFYSSYALSGVSNPTLPSNHSVVLIENNKITGAIKYDYSAGDNAMESAINIHGYSGVVVSGNSFSNGVDTPIKLDTCDNINIVSNVFNCVPHPFEGDSMVNPPSGVGYVDISSMEGSGYHIIGNSGFQYDSYIEDPVYVNGEPDGTVNNFNMFT